MTLTPIRIGSVAPLSRPGWTDAGLHLLAGLRLGVRELNDAGGIDGSPVELLTRDTSGDPLKAAAAVDDLVASGVTALAGEYHSVVARAVAARACVRELPYLCTSAVIDDLVEEPTGWVARICPPQSRGWAAYGEFLLDEGHTQIAVIVQPGAYWEAGFRILQEQFVSHGGSVVRLDASTSDLRGICDEIAVSGATVLLLLVGMPDPAVAIVRSARRDPRLHALLIGTPAGQAEFPSWHSLLGKDGASVPFLRYLPERLGPLGLRVATELEQALNAVPSFVAFEGYDGILVLADLLSRPRGEGTPSWDEIDVEGSRGRIQFSRAAETGLWQWMRAPIQIAVGEFAEPQVFRTLRNHQGFRSA
jgi:ABC-type branched-subunit amino acid transport system substrate-binding protein